MQRRNFIAKSCVACMAFIGAGVLLEGCSTGLPLIKIPPKDKSLFVPLHNFSGNKNLLIVRSGDLEDDILLVKKANVYTALYLKCTHEGVGLTATDKKIFCSAHGSAFDFEGNVLKEPALRPLQQFHTEVVDDNLVIHLL